MQRDLVALRPDLGQQRGPPAHLLADDEEGRPAPARASSSRITGVPSGCGPSSNVSATPGAAGIVRASVSAAAASGVTGASRWWITVR